MTATPPPPDLSALSTLTARCPEDFLAAAPVLLGFWPRESVVMMTFGASRSFHARLDLPPPEVQGPWAWRELARTILEPAARLGARGVVQLYFSTDALAASAAHRAVVRQCRRVGIVPIAAIFADGESWSWIGPDGATGPPTPYDVSAHPFVVEALVAGRLTHRTREDMVASLELDPVLARPVLAALGGSGLLDCGEPSDGRSIRRHGQWVAETVARAVAGGELPEPAAIARLLWTMQATRVRDAAWSLIDRPGAAAQVRFWSAVLCRTPDALAPAPATLLGWAAWQAGDGALAWAAVDRCRRAEPAYELADHLATLLKEAVPPDLWSGGFDWTLGLPPEERDAE